MPQWLSSLSALQEDQGTIPSTHIVAYNNNLERQFQRFQCSLLASAGAKHVV